MQKSTIRDRKPRMVVKAKLVRRVNGHS